MFFFILTYIISFFGLFFCLFNYTKYLERSHIREKCRIFGKKINKYLSNNFLFENFLNQILVLNEGVNGFLEGIMNLESMVELYSPESKEIIKEIVKEKIIEIPVYNEEKIIEEIKKIFNPKIPLLEFINEEHINIENFKGTTINTTPQDQSLFNKIERILNIDSIKVYTENKYEDNDEDNTKLHFDENIEDKKYINVNNNIFIKKNQNLNEIEEISDKFDDNYTDEIKIIKNVSNIDSNSIGTDKRKTKIVIKKNNDSKNKNNKIKIFLKKNK